MLRLAGLRINPATSGPHGARRTISVTLKRVGLGLVVAVIGYGVYALLKSEPVPTSGESSLGQVVRRPDP